MIERVMVWVAPLALCVITGVLILCGKDSVITDLFCASGGGLLVAAGISRVSGKSTPNT